MKLYFAGADCKISYDNILVSNNAACRLLSFNALNKKYVFNKKFDTYFLDSGAYSVSTGNATINIDKYIEYILHNVNTFDLYSTLDVIGDYSETVKNTIYMEKKGLTPLPVFHYKSPKKNLLHLIDKYEYIALGGLVPLVCRKKILISWLDFCFDIIKDKVKVHGFGMNSRIILERYPFYSVDSSMWLSMVKYGKSINKHNKPKKINTPEVHLINTEGEAKYWVNFERYITAFWKTRDIYFDQ